MPRDPLAGWGWGSLVSNQFLLQSAWLEPVLSQRDPKSIKEWGRERLGVGAGSRGGGRVTWRDWRLSRRGGNGTSRTDWKMGPRSKEKRSGGSKAGEVSPGGVKLVGSTDFWNSPDWASGRRETWHSRIAHSGLPGCTQGWARRTHRTLAHSLGSVLERAGRAWRACPPGMGPRCWLQGLR